MNNIIDDFLLMPVPTGLDSKRKAYHEGCKILGELTPGTVEYKWAEAKIKRILKAIDK